MNIFFPARRKAGTLWTPLEEKRRREENFQRLIAFLVPILTFYFGFVAHGLWPFGNRHLLAYDLYHQYAPFLLELKRKILSGDSLFFSWTGGLGVNFYSIFTYYTASPLNLLTLLFPDRFIAEAVTVITLLKLGLSSVFFREFLTRAFRPRDPLAALFSAFYALSAWVYAYSWNIMWLDTLVFLPLAVLGLVELVRDRKPGLFILGLTLMLATNYYTAFFGAVFLFLYFFVVHIQFPSKSGGEFTIFKRLGSFAGASLFSALLSAVILWPTARALSITSAAGDAFPQGFTFTQPFLEVLGRMTPLREPHIMSGLPNIFSGFFVLLLVPAFFAARKRPVGVKFAYGTLLGFLFFSFQSRTLSFLWHGGHYPNSLDFRYSFVFVLLVLAMSYQAADEELGQSRRAAVISAVSVFILLLAEQQWQQNDSLSHWRLLASAVLSVLYLAVFSGFLSSRLPSAPLRSVPYSLGLSRPGGKRLNLKLLRNFTRKKAGYWEPRERARALRFQRAGALLFIVLAVELFFHAFTAAALYQKVAPLGDRKYYTSNTHSAEIYGYMKSLKKENKGQPWRAEVLPDTCVNDPFLYGSNGMSLFASPFPQASIDFFADLGYPTNGVNSFQYKESTIVMDSILSIDYLAVRNNRVFDDRTRTEVAAGEETRLLKNEDALPFGFFATAEAGYLTEEWMPEDAPDVQNRLLSALSGLPGVLVKEPFRPWMEEGCHVEHDYDAYSFRVMRAAGDSDWAFLVYDVPEDGIYYLFWEDLSAGINYSNGFVRDMEFFQLGSSKRGIGDVGFLPAGSQLHFRVSMPSEHAIDGSFRACVARLDEAAWSAAREELASHPLDLDHFSSSSFSGRISAPKDGYLFLPTTGNPGWTFRVDGVKTEAESIRGSFIILPLSAGDHQIQARFVPVGFYTGLAVTLTSLAALGAAVLYKRKRRSSCYD
ncbi:MAG TPA: YfhO family protein [Clostridiaceae bacterium]|nr:YfhO family protein [Clostridiaceae bacterium]